MLLMYAFCTVAIIEKLMLLVSDSYCASSLGVCLETGAMHVTFDIVVSRIKFDFHIKTSKLVTKT